MIFSRSLCLIVSGGHTELVLMTGIGKYTIIGQTLDDAAGEAFDKIARILKLGYRAVQQRAEAEQLSTFNFQLSTKLPDRCSTPKPETLVFLV